MRKGNSLSNRVIAFVLCIIMLAGVLPTSAFAADQSSLTTDIHEKVFVAGRTTEFTLNATANSNAGKYVLNIFEFSDPSAVEKLEFLDSSTNTWYSLKGDFGPDETGFPMTDATGRFRVTFSKPGDYTVKASIVTVEDRTVLCSVSEEVSVIYKELSVLSTNIGGVSFVTGKSEEFTVTTTANADAGTYVVGNFAFSDPAAVEKLEYQDTQSGRWYEFDGELDPTGDGFPMTDATNRFRVTFKKAGNYTLTASWKTAADGIVLCKAESNITVGSTEQIGFAFADPNPVDQWVGSTYKNVATGGQSDETVIYEIVDGPATIANDGTVTFTGIGAVTVKATRPGNDFYKAASATYVVTSVKNSWEPFAFAVSNPTITYAPELSYPNTNAENPLTGGDKSVTFAIVDGEELVLRTEVANIDPATGVLTILKSGVVTVRATRAADSLYIAATCEYTLTVKKADQSFVFNHDKQIVEEYGLTSFETQITTSEHNSGTVTYAVSGDNIGASVDNRGVVTFVDSEQKIGTITVTVTMVGNDCYNAFTDSYTITLGYETTPANPYSLHGNKIVDNSVWFTGDVTIKAPAGYQISYGDSLSDENVWSDSVVWNEDGENGKWNDGEAPKVYLRNTATNGITDVISVSDLKRDTTDPQDLSISYTVPVEETIWDKIFGFSKETVQVTVSATDAMSGIAKMEYSLNNGEDGSYVEVIAQNGAYTFDIPAEYRGQVWLKATDIAGNETVITHKDGDTDKILVVDSTCPSITVTYASGMPNTAVNFPFNKNAVEATIAVTEANFFEGATGTADGKPVHEIIIKVTKTDDNGVKTVTEYLCAGAQQLVAGAQTKDIVWTPDGDTYTTSITFADDGDYVLEISYVDFSENEAEVSGTDGNNGNATYTSKVITIDTTAPVISIDYDNKDALNDNNYKDNRVATITVLEHNFDPKDVKVFDTNGDGALAVDIFGQKVAVADYAALAVDPDSWYYRKADGSLTANLQEAVNPNEHILQLTFNTDAVYDFDVSYTDLAGNNDTGFAVQSFVVDHTPAKNIQITYTTPVFGKIIEALSFGFYKAEVVVTVTAEDMTSGVDYFELSYTRDEDATDAHTDDFMQKLMAQPGTDAKTFTASYTVPAQARGSYSVVVYDRAGNDSVTDDRNSIVATDTVSPEIKVDFAAKDPNTEIRFVDSNKKDVATFAEAANAFYNGDVVATITVNEANFFEGRKSGTNNDEIVHEIIIKVTKTDDKGVKTVTEYLCAGAEQLVEGASKKLIAWTSVGDTHTVNIPFTDDGDYVLEIDYTDFSENRSNIVGNDGVAAEKTYASTTITVDETAPIVNVTYSNTDVINTIDGIKYLNETQSAVITVTEHNFRAEDIAIAITAKDVTGADVDDAADLYTGNWDANGDIYTTTVQYAADANYTFDIEYQDLAKNKAAEYEQDLFTVDTTAPEKLEVKYSTSVFEQIKESITFGYYNAMMTVTLTAEDDTSGIYHFAYSYIKGKDVSGVNAELLDQAIKEAEITHDGKKATATFRIPKMVLGSDNQFNGTVEFTAFDRSENNTELKDSAVIVVDNITPTSTITYNAPVQNANNISYYNGDIDATIVIDEANFDAKDVIVAVTKDGKNFPVNVTWKDDSVDTHTGTFTLTQDGDYIVSVQYKDKSGNQMTTYESNELTVDTTKPTIKVSNIKADSANKDETYGFVITVDDTNLDASSIKAVLKATKQNEAGIYETVDVDLGNARTVVNGQTYTYTVENLPDDGIYTLTCSVKDMSANGTTRFALEDGETYDQVQFSINRNGSTFGYGNAFTEELVAQYYVYSVVEDVVIVEVNVDPIEDYKVSLNGKELMEGTEYTTSQTSKEGEWSKRTYTIKKDLFEEEGEYSIIVSSTDKADTTAFSDIKKLPLAFVVDQTKPAVTITGLEAGGRYRTELQTVTLIPTDEGGRLNSLTVLVLDSDGNPMKDDSGADISVRFEKSGEELLKHLEENDGKVTFTIPEGLNSKVRIICNDCAVNTENQTNEYNELFERVTVSPNRWVIFYANTPLFVGSIVGVLAVIGLIIFLIKRKKDKKSKTAAKA